MANARDYMTIFEKTAVLSARATDIADGSALTIPPGKIPPGSSPIQIAKMEMAAGTCPYKIARDGKMIKVSTFKTF